MPKSAAETAHEILRKNNEKVAAELNAMSPNSRQSLRLASQSTSTNTAESTLRNPTPVKDKDKKRSQGKKRSPSGTGQQGPKLVQKLAGVVDLRRQIIHALKVGIQKKEVVLTWISLNATQIIPDAW